MPKRTQLFQQIPWSGGVNTSVDAGVLPPSDFTICDNVTFTSAGIKKKREGFNYFDALSDVPNVISRSSSGTTRTLVFDAALTSASIDKLISGELINIVSTAGAEANYIATEKAIASITTTTITNDTLTYTMGSSFTEANTATTSITVERFSGIVHIADFWYFNGASMEQQIIAVTEQPKIFKYDLSGRRKECTGSITARVISIDKASTITFNNQLVIFMQGIGNVPVKWDGTTLTDLHATAPDASFGAVFLSRIWCNDKTDSDRVHFSSTGYYDEWIGVGDSGYFNIRPGDGDPVGVTGLIPFKGRLIMAKRDRVYQLLGDSPENFQIDDLSAGLGILSQNTIVPIDQDDVMYLSSKGIHSLNTTASYGDFETQYVSAEIQPSFNDWELSRMPFVSAAYIPTINAVAFSIPEDSTNYQDNIWLFDIIAKKWYRWPEIEHLSIGRVQLANKACLMIGTRDGRLIRTQNGNRYDYASTAINYRMRTGVIYPDQNPNSVKAFKRLTIFFRPETTFAVIARVKIDNYREQTIGFNATAEGDLLGVSFVLGSSVVGNSFHFAPFTSPIDGYGRGIIIDIEQTSSNTQADIYGYALEYEVADTAQETITGGNN
jgi:hypothetical protein